MDYIAYIKALPLSGHSWKNLSIRWRCMAKTHVYTLAGISAVAATACLQRECLDSKDGYSSTRVLQLNTQPLLVNILQQHTQTAYLGEVEVCVCV